MIHSKPIDKLVESTSLMEESNQDDSLEDWENNVDFEGTLMDDFTELDQQMPLQDQEQEGSRLEDADYDIKKKVRKPFQNDSI